MFQSILDNPHVIELQLAVPRHSRLLKMGTNESTAAAGGADRQEKASVRKSLNRRAKIPALAKL